MIGILATDKAGGIGADNDLLFRYKKDLLHFKSVTEHNVCIMGRKTFNSLNMKKGLSNRINIVLTNDKQLRNEEHNKTICNASAGVYYVNSERQLFRLLANIKGKLFFLIGGAEIYKLLEDFVHTWFITEHKLNLSEPRENSGEKITYYKAPIEGMQHETIYKERFFTIKKFEK
jgi:dihydrofolate reductase